MFKLIKNNGVQISLNCKKRIFLSSKYFVSLQNTYARPKKYGPNISVQKVKEKKVQSTSSKEIQYTCAMQKSIKKRRSC